MYNRLFLAVTLLVGAAACSVVESPEPTTEQIISFTAEPFTIEEDGWVETKTNIQTGGKFVWSPGDTVGVYPSSGSQVYFVMTSEVEASSAEFDGGGWDFKPSAVYRSYYPFIGNIYLDATKIPVQYIGEKQVGNNNSSHIGPYDFMYTPASSAVDGRLSFHYSHLSIIIMPQVELPAGHYTGLKMSLDEALFTTQGEYDLTSATPKTVGKHFEQEVSMELDVTLSKADNLVAYYVTAPLDMRGKTLTITVYDENGREFIYTYTPSKDYVAGKIYSLRSAQSFYVSSISLDSSELALSVDQTHLLTATILPENTANKNVTWSSSNPSVATVDSNGKVTGVAPGSAIITVSTVEGNKSTTCNVTVSALDDLSTPLSLEAVEAGTITVSNPLALTIEYKKNSADWVSASDASIEINVAVGDRVYFRGNNASYATSDDVYTNISCSANAYVYGNVMSLINSSEFAALKKLTGNLALAGLFRNNAQVLNHPEREILLPATQLSSQCYRYMFNKCSGLTSAPALPAMKVTSCGYKYMFQGCTSLATPPELPATEVMTNGYFGMFAGCSSLTYAPDLPATSLGIECYYQMFLSCTSLTTAPEVLPATNLPSKCYSGMFNNCTLLENAPALPATTLSEQCYYQMFRDCKALNNAPALPATALATSCYQGMFYGCTALTSAPELPAMELAERCYYQMFTSCTALVTPPSLPAMSLAKLCYYEMFRYNTKMQTAPALPATVLADGCYTNMFMNCTKLSSPPVLPAMDLLANCYQNMFYGCVQLETAPILPAEILAEQSYRGMFAGCSKLNYIKMLATDISAADAMTDWVKNVASTGTFVKNFDATWNVLGINGIPEGWTVERVLTRDPILVSNISLSKTSLTLTIGSNETITASVEPSNADDKSLTWSSGDITIATVDQTGKITAIKDGSTTITVRANDESNKSATCAVTVRPISVTSVTLNQTSLSLNKGNSITLTATVKPDNATYKTVTWSSSNSSVATVDTNGKVTAVAGGSAVITATADGKSAECSVTVTVPVSSVTLNKTTTTINKGGNETLIATINPNDATDITVSWSSSNTSVATVAAGKVTAIAPGTATITASVGGKSATCIVTVPELVTGVTLNFNTLELTSIGATKTLVATVLPSDATNKSVTWTSSNSNVATVSSEGVVTAKAAGTATITVTTVEGGKTATCTVTVRIPVTSVTLNTSNITLTSIGATEALTPTVNPSNATNKTVSWSSSNTSVATVSSSGVVTAKGVGTATITVTTEDGNKTATCSIRVYIPVTSVTLNNTTLSLSKGSTYSLVATVYPTNATDKGVIWSTSNSDVATVSDSGVITAVGKGSAVITVRTNDGGYSKTCNVTVTVPVTGVSLNYSSLTLPVNGTATLTATILPADANNQAVTWTTSNSTVASVSAGKITAKAKGTATITVKTSDGSYTATCVITVDPSENTRNDYNYSTGWED